MCGITGFINGNGKNPSLPLLTRMTEVISYRGPDDQGLMIRKQCALGSRRLAVIDLTKRAHQPLWDRERTHCIVYNGEIYNYQKLRDTLIKKGYRFLSDSDTEVIVNLYKAYGSDAVRMLEGMFAFAIWDTRKEELFIARDRFGMKPLYYYLDRKVFIFASEMKSILLHPNVRKEINPRALSHYFSLGFGCIASPESIFSSIVKLPPGHVAMIAGGTIHLKKYYGILDNVHEISVSQEEAVAKTRALLSASVNRQMVSDVPLGVFLSGGIDSSLIASLAQRASRTPIQTFSIGFSDALFDESSFARKVAAYLQTDHHHEVFRSKDLFRVLPRVIEKLDEPLGDPSILPTFLLSAVARTEVTVALSGDGGDELFIGYPTSIAHMFADRLDGIPAPVFDVLRAVLPGIELAMKPFPFMGHAPTISTREKLDRFLGGIHKNKARQYIDFMAALPLRAKDALIIDHQERALPFVEALLSGVKDVDRQTQIQYLDYMIFLAEDCLVKVDRASSCNSLEVRVPFLDTHLVRYVLSLPLSCRSRGLTLKYLLKRVAKELLPDEIIDRPKMGFGIPIDALLRGGFKSMLLSYLSKQKIKKQGLFHDAYIDRLTREHLSGVSDHGRILWSILIFQLWHETWFE